MKCWHVDAFAEKVFEGNPAAVCVLDGWPEDALLQAIAGENNLSETAYAVRDGERWRLRWFTPGGGDRPLRPRHAGHGLRPRELRDA